MSKPFIIWTMRRTGGTALTDLLMEMSEYETIDHEPFQFHRKLGHINRAFDRQKNGDKSPDVLRLLDEALVSKPLIKHAYEIVDADFNEMLAKYIKSTEYKHLFLIRKDEVSRVLSLFTAYQSGVWGKHGSESTYEMIRSGQKKLEPFDLDAMKIEEERSMKQTRRIRAILDRESIEYMDIYFEDFYTGEEESRRENLYALLDYLEFDEETIRKHEEMIWHILFNRDQKSRSIMEYVPNYTEAKEMLEKMTQDDTGYEWQQKKKKDPDITIKLYLGAHKTATTHLQGILLANREILSTSGIKLSAPQNVRKAWLPAFFRYCNKQEEGALDIVQSYAPDDGTWILTEENIAGVSNDFACMPGMYPDAGRRLQCIKDAFSNAEIELFFSIRSYDSFYRSAYSEVVRNRGYLPFSEFYDSERYHNNSWVEMVRMFVEVLPQEKITLWCFEDFRGLVPELLRRMTDLEDAEKLIANYKSETTRPSLSQKTIDILESLYPAISREESKKLVERINRAYPIGDDYAPLIPFDEEQIDSFRMQYRQDVERIRRKFPYINFLQA